jgi:GNAT superfamily N-acetyltransferase
MTDWHLTIRPADIHDVPKLAALTGELGYSTSADLMAEWLAPLLESDRDHIFVADAEESCVGWMHVSLVRSLESEAFVEIRGIVVTERLRGTGIGIALIARAEQWTRERSCKRLRLRTNMRRLEAHEFYARRGFEVVKEQKVFEKRV